MKKILLAISVAQLLSASQVSDKTTQFLKTLIPNKAVEIEVVNASKIPNSDYEMIEFNILLDNKVIGSDIFFSNGKYGTPALFDMDLNIDYKDNYMKKKEEEKTNAIVKQLSGFLKTHSDMVVDLGNHDSDLATVVFTDPDCPWCRKHLANIEEDLATQNIKLVLMPLPMHENAIHKTIEILKKIKDKKTDAEKLKLLRMYFSDDVSFARASDKQKEEYEKKVKDVADLGVSYTPAIFENIKVK